MKISLDDVTEREVVPGFFGRFVHSDSMTFAYWRIQAGSSLPPHDHVHEQVVNMLEGAFELELDGEPHRLEAGDLLRIPSGVPHGGRALTDCRILDVFQPVREDYREAQET